MAGFGGLRHDSPQLARLAFRLHDRHRALHIEITPGQARYELLAGPPLTLEHHRRPFNLALGDTVTHPIPPPISAPRPHRPSGREPNPRSDTA
nr:glycosyl hydrolase family 65 protein [Nocardia jiangxiensis]